jgi:hypothetical protein
MVEPEHPETDDEGETPEILASNRRMEDDQALWALLPSCPPLHLKF